MMRSLSCQNDNHDNNNSDEAHVWITELEAQCAAKRDNWPLTIWEGTWVDVSTVEPWSQTRLLRLRPEYDWTPVHDEDDHDHYLSTTPTTGMDGLPSTNKGTESEVILLQRRRIQEWERTANEVARVTMDWCRDFVLPLHLCPWAKASIQSQSTAIRIKVIPQTHGFYATTTPVRDGGGGGGGDTTRSSSSTTTGRRMDMDDIGMEPALRTAALELLLLTGQITLPSSNNKNNNKNDDDMMSGPVSEFKTADPNVAITFLVAAPLPPKSSHDEYKSLELVKEPHLFEFEFENFYQSVTDLEDQLFEEADRCNENNAQKQQGNNPVVMEYENGMLGDLITMAPFHPDWEFASENGNDSDDHAAIQYEKKAPYPMISLVCTSAITEAGEIVSETIGQQNAETLTHMGPHALGQLFRSAISPRRQQQQ